MKIITAQRGDTAEYFTAELKKYMMQMSRGDIVPEISWADTLPEKPEDAIVLALLEELQLDTSDLTDPFIEDIIDINIQNGCGYIAGSNERSILMGVYKYCTSAGCRFIRPGADGDYVPKADLYAHSYTYRKKADQPFRGECTEGAIGYEHLRDTAYWLPKIGMNMYMIEGLVPYSYMHKWYGHVYNTKLRQKGQVTDYAMLEDYIRLLEKDVKRTGIQLHTLGHGWMFERFGIRRDKDMDASALMTPEQKRHLALVGGKRDIFGGSTFYTQFCYSNPETRKLLVDTLTDYIKSKPHVDFVHVWLADAPNNLCECEECQKKHLSDFYVMLLNELDEEMTKMGLKQRIVLIMYVETERPPQTERLKNPKRFVLNTAIGLHYENGYVNEPFAGEEPPFVLNQYHPKSAPLRLKWHRDWKALCDNIPSMIFEYRFYTDMYCDLGNMQIARETYRDMKSLKGISFNGCMSDQTDRMALPTALPRVLMGETLFDSAVDFDSLTDGYFAGAFGEDGALCRRYLETLSDLLCPSNQRIGSTSGVEEAAFGDEETMKQCWINNPAVAEKAARIPAHIEAFLPVIEKNISSASDNAQRLSWIYLKQHASICQHLAGILLAGAQNDMDKARALFKEMQEYLSEHEMEYHPVFDMYLFLRSVAFKVRQTMPHFFD